MAYDNCEVYDVDAVEKAFVATSLVQKCPHLMRTQEGLSWAKPNGGFCRRYMAAAVATRAAFNENPFFLQSHGRTGHFDDNLK